ncbi:hypothetical protein GJ496_008996 [Pomphorhynchus laevis]|nr:hypothetical protein GJ496_008996 [Pomphorhynchus laevis]
MDLKSKFGMELKREMLHALCDKDKIRPDDKSLADELYEKYKKYKIPEEEIDWLGLDLVSALKKMYQLESNTYNQQIRPWKDIYKEQLMMQLKCGKTESSNIS